MAFIRTYMYKKFIASRWRGGAKHSFVGRINFSVPITFLPVLRDGEFIRAIYHAFILPLLANCEVRYHVIWLTCVSYLSLTYLGNVE